MLLKMTCFSSDSYRDFKAGLFLEDTLFTSAAHLTDQTLRPFLPPRKKCWFQSSLMQGLRSCLKPAISSLCLKTLARPLNDSETTHDVGLISSATLVLRVRVYRRRNTCWHGESEAMHLSDKKRRNQLLSLAKSG